MSEEEGGEERVVKKVLQLSCGELAFYSLLVDTGFNVQCDGRFVNQRKGRRTSARERRILWNGLKIKFWCMADLCDPCYKTGISLGQNSPNDISGDQTRL
jgi:hypothetical protein